MISIYCDSGASGTKGPIVKDSGGVSKIEEEVIFFASPTIKTEELDTAVILISPTDIS